MNSVALFSILRLAVFVLYSMASLFSLQICQSPTGRNLESSIPTTETPPPGYMSEDGDPTDHNDNMSEC